jgi:NADP-dependent 3-hydroxy acid dehydrogenase YdfG
MITNNDEKQNIETDLKHLVIITGASRGIGKAYADYYRSKENTTVMGICHSNKPELIQLDLLDEPAVNNFILQLDINQFEDIVYMHAVGIDKFEPDTKPHIDLDGDGIDDEIYATNVTAFLNMAEPLIEKTRQNKKPITVVNIGSISDIYEVPYWQSFSRSKNIVRRYLKSIIAQNVKSIILNVSSTLDENNNKYGRIKADITYWQSAKELVAKSIGVLDGMGNLDSNYLEIDFYKHNPNFRQDYFTNLPKLFLNWQRDMGFVGKEIPSGIRI